MLFKHVARPRTKLAWACQRHSSTVVGQSGRTYARSQVLQHHRKNPALSIFRAESGGESFVVKQVSAEFYDLSQRLTLDLKGSRRLRVHTDCNHEQGVLIFPYYKNTLLALIQNDVNFPYERWKKILRHVGEAIQELHNKDWLRIDIKPHNVLVNWEYDEADQKIVDNAALADFDLIFKCDTTKSLNTAHVIGNAMWRSPEGQTAIGVTKASDVYSFGLVCIYVMGGGDFLLLKTHQKLMDDGIPPEQKIVTRHFCYFGPLPDALLEHIGDETWNEALEWAAKDAAKMLKDDPPGAQI